MEHMTRHAHKDYLAKLELLDKIAEDSKLTEKDALEIGELIKERVWKRHLKGDNR